MKKATVMAEEREVLTWENGFSLSTTTYNQILEAFSAEGSEEMWDDRQPQTQTGYKMTQLYTDFQSHNNWESGLLPRQLYPLSTVNLLH